MATLGLYVGDLRLGFFAVDDPQERRGKSLDPRHYL